jgi:prepilin-type N-terminal cleavage/methylation domain-containing protein
VDSTKAVCEGRVNGKKAVHKKLRGFTIIELIVVIAIIGILASILTIAMSIYVRGANIDKQNSNARVAYSTVTDWLVDMEVKNVDLHRFVVGASTGNPNNTAAHYFEICSRSLIEDSTGFNLADPYELYVSLNKTGPFSLKPEFFEKDDILDQTNATATADGLTIGANSPILIEWFDKLGDTFSTGTNDFVWRAIINADDYSVLMVYAEDLQVAQGEKATPEPDPTGYRIFTNNTKTGADDYIFPHTLSGGSYGFDIITQENNIIADTKNLYGQYPFGPIYDKPLS